MSNKLERIKLFYDNEKNQTFAEYKAEHNGVEFGDLVGKTGDLTHDRRALETMDRIAGMVFERWKEAQISA